MSEETKISEALKEIKESNEDKLKEVIQEWYNKIHTQSMKIGASYISAAVYDAITKNIKTAFKVAQCLETGTVIINGSTEYRSNEMAYGGWKYSGFGTEGVSSTLEQLSLVKTIVLKNVLE